MSPTVDSSGMLTVFEIAPLMNGWAAAIILMWTNSWLEPEYSRLAEIRVNVRDVVAQAKRELGGGASATADSRESDGQPHGAADADPVTGSQVESLVEPLAGEAGP